MKFTQILRCTACLGAIFLIDLTASAQTYYIRSGGTGSWNGSDWNNAFPTLPPTLVRGATYYVASGEYPGYNFKTPESGTTPIVIKKATAADHGVNTGWQTAYDGVATFTGTLTFSTKYWVFDGQTGGGPGSWTSGYGFKIAVTSPTSGMGVRIMHNMGQVTIRHLEIQGNGGDGDGASGAMANDGFVLHDNANNTTLSYTYVHDMGRCLIFCGADNMTVEYMYGGVYESTSGQHSEIASIWRGNGDNSYANQVKNTTFANCIFSGIYGTGGIVVAGDGLTVYGCVFFRPPNASFTVGNGAIGTWSANILSNAKIYNNTFIDLQDKPALGMFMSRYSVSGNVAKNNLFYKCSVNFGKFDSHDYNHFVDVLPSSNDTTEANRSANSGDPFVNYTALDFRLKAQTPTGTALGAPFDKDPTGVTRASDGVITRGAYELAGGSNPPPLDTTPPVISNMNAQQVSINGATVVWTTDESSTSFVDYGTSANYGSTVSVTGLSSSHTVAIANLASATVYNYRVRSADAAGNPSISGNFTFKTLAAPIADSTPPTVSVGSPTAGSVLSSQVTLTATASDNTGGSGIARVAYFVDGTPIGNGANNNNNIYTLSWDTRSVANGSHVLRASALDAAGNQSNSADITVSIQNNAPDLRTGLVAYWTLDEASGNPADSAGSNSGTAYNGVSRAAGQLSGAFSFDGTDDYVSIQSSPVLNLTDAVSFSAWVKPAPNGGWQSVVRKLLQEGSHTYPYTAYDLLLVDAGGSSFQPRISISGTDGKRVIATGPALPYGSWYHILGTYDRASLNIYVNGALAATAPYTAPMLQSNQPLYIGKNGAGGDLLKGIMDDVRIYSRAMSATEAQALYKAKSPLPPTGVRTN